MQHPSLKKATCGGFAVYHEGINEYAVRNIHTGSICSLWPNLSQAFSAARRRDALEKEEGQS